MTFSGARRSFIKYLMLIASLPILSKLPIPVYAGDDEVKCDELNSDDRDRAIEEALESKDYRNVAPSIEEYDLEPDLEGAKAFICETREGEEINISIPYKADNEGNNLSGVIIYIYRERDKYSSARAILTRYDDNEGWYTYLLISSVNGEIVKLDDTTNVTSHCGGCAATCYANSEECIEWDTQCLIQCGSLVTLCRLTCTCCLSFWLCCPPCIACAMGDLYCRVLCCREYKHVCTRCTGVAC